MSQSITAGEDMMEFSAMGVYGGGCSHIDKPRTRQDPETGYNLQGLPLVSHFLQLGPMSQQFLLKLFSSNDASSWEAKM